MTRVKWSERGVYWDSGLNERQCNCRGFETKGRSVLAACLVLSGDRILLSRRSVPPRVGFWTIPGGYVEDSESAEEGALRELSEEAGVRVTDARLFAVYEMPQISQVLFMYTAHSRAATAEAQAGPESSAVVMCPAADVPLRSLAFASDRRALVRLQTNINPDQVEVGCFRWKPKGNIKLTVSCQLTTGRRREVE